MSSEANFDTNEVPKTPSTNSVRKNKKLPLSSFYEKSTNYELKVPRTWLILMTIRIALNVFFQRGYIHPDEFFQGVEPISGDLFNCSDKMIYRAWEFQMNKTSGQEPIRNMAVPYFFYGIPLLILKYFSSLGSIRDYTAYINDLNLTPSNFNMISVHANTLIYYPRLFMTFYSLVIDICIYLICDLCDLDKSSILITFASSYITLVYLTRTFSNSIEAILFSLLILFILKSIKTQRVLNDKFLVATNESANERSFSSSSAKRQISKVTKIVSTTTSPELASNLEGKSSSNIQPHSLNALKRLRLFDIYKYNNLSSQIGIVTCVGVFNRPTFIIFSFVPLLYWLLYGLENCNHFSEWLRYLWRRCLSLIKFAVPLAFLFVLFDTCYFYKINSVKMFQEIIMKQHKLIVTPYNFFSYNSKSENLKEHGEHPIFQHFLNCFLLFGLNHIVLMLIFLQFFLQIFTMIKNNNNSNETVLLSQQELAKKSAFERIKIKIIGSKFYSNITELYKQLINNTFCFFLFSFLMPLIVFSLISHKEPRFLIPLIIPVCLLTSHSIFGIQSYSILRFIWISFNFVCLIIYGYMHQGGVVPALGHVQKMFSHVANLEMDQHVIFYHTYMPPRYLVMVPLSHNFLNNHRYAYELKKIQNQFDVEAGAIENNSSSKDKSNKKKDNNRPVRKIYDLMSSGTSDQLENLIFQISNSYKKKNSTRISKNYAIFLVSPSLLDIELKRTTFNDNCLVNDSTNQTYYQLQASFKFHITFEHLLQHLDVFKCNFDFYLSKANFNEEKQRKVNCYINKCKSLNIFQRIFNSFSLNLYQVIL